MLVSLLHTPKTGAAVAGTTLTTGLSTLMDWLPNSVGEVASIVGIILSGVLIYVHLRKSGREALESEAKIAILKLKKQALERGLALKRLDDIDDE